MIAPNEEQPYEHCSATPCSVAQFDETVATGHGGSPITQLADPMYSAHVGNPAGANGTIRRQNAECATTRAAALQMVSARTITAGCNCDRMRTCENAVAYSPERLMFLRTQSQFA